MTAKKLFDLFCERFAAINDRTKPFPTVLIMEFIAGKTIVFYAQESNWYQMSSTSLKAHYSQNTGYNYSYEQNAIIESHQYDFNSNDFEDLRNQFDEIKSYTGFSNASSMALHNHRHIIALTHFDFFSLETPKNYENIVFNHTLNTILKTYDHYQKPVFSKHSFDKKVHTFILHWFESYFNYHLYFDTAENKKVHFSNVLYIENDVQLMLKRTHKDQEAFFVIWMILYRVCAKLRDALADHPMFLPDFKCYPAFFNESEQYEEYRVFAEKHKELDMDPYIELLLETFKIPLI